MAKRTRRERMEAKLPLRTGPATFITGFVCDDWMVNNKQFWPYSRCCQDPSNWEGRGEWQALSNDGDLPDPYYLKGYRFYRPVFCAVCDVNQIATEYAVSVNVQEASDAD